MKHVKIYDRENDCIHGGIITDNGNVVCGCCGGLIERSEISIVNCKNSESIKHFYENNKDDDCNTEIIEVFAEWIDLSYAIIGE